MSTVLLPNQPKKKVIVKKVKRKILVKKKKNQNGTENGNNSENNENVESINDNIDEKESEVNDNNNPNQIEKENNDENNQNYIDKNEIPVEEYHEEAETEPKKKKKIIKKIIKKKKLKTENDSNINAINNDEEKNEHVILPPINNIGHTENQKRIDAKMESITDNEQKEKTKKFVKNNNKESKKITFQTIEEDSEKTKELKLKLLKLHNQIRYDEANFPQELLEYNLKISDYNEQLSLISKKNSSLLKKLSLLKYKLDNVFEKKMKNFNLHSANYKQTNADNLEEIELKQLQNLSKMIEIYKRDTEKLRNKLSLHENSENTVDVMEKDLSDKNDKISDIKNEISELKKLKDYHSNFCLKKKDKLFDQLSHLRMEHDYLKREESQRLSFTKNRSYGSPQRSKRSKISNTYSTSNVRSPFYDEFTKLNKQKLTSTHRYNKSSFQGSSLFNQDEKAVLEKIIPKDIMEKFDYKFSNIENEKQDIEDKLALQRQIKTMEKNMIYNNYTLCVEQGKIVQRQQSTLNLQIKNNEKTKKNLNKKLSDLLKKNEKVQMELDEKEKINEELRKQIELLTPPKTEKKKKKVIKKKVIKKKKMKNESQDAPSLD